jgi:hypothetical protein
MKKGRIILVAIAVMTVAGGSLAFKAQKGTQVYTTDGLNKPANITVFDATLAPSGTPAFASTVFNGPAISTFTIAND